MIILRRFISLISYMVKNFYKLYFCKNIENTFTSS
jgi:hypothetical protein